MSNDHQTGTAEQIEEVLMYIRDERRCITARWVSRNFGISRREASLLLEDAISSEIKKASSQKAVYEVTRMICRVGKERNGKDSTIKQKLVSLVKEVIDSSKANNGTNIKSQKYGRGSIYSIAIRTSPDNPTPTLQTAHEHDLSNLRDAIQLLNQDQVFDSNLLTCSIKPATNIVLKRSDFESLRSRRIHSMNQSGGKNTDQTTTLSSKSSLARIQNASNKRKATTAESFFKTTSTKTNKLPRKTTTKTTNNISSTMKMNPKTRSKQKSKETDSFINDDQNSDKSDTNSDQEINTKDDVSLSELNKPTRKSKRINNAAPTMKKKKSSTETFYGNADDFVGDEDEDEEDLKQDDERKKRNVVEEMKQVREISARAATFSKNKSSRRKLSTDADTIDDDDYDEKSRKKAQKANEKRMRPESPVEHEYDDCNENVTKTTTNSSKTSMYGSMDLFTKKKQKTNETDATTQVSRKRQRKKLVEKTTIDDKGYMHMEMVTTWEDIPSDEENNDHDQNTNNNRKNTGFSTGKKQGTLADTNGKSNQALSATAKPKKKNPNGMKQAGLMGFFKKK